MGSGASQSLYEAAGKKQIEKECSDLLKKFKRQLGVGVAVPTRAGKLNAKYLIHTIVPRWIDGNHDEYAKLCTAYLAALELADQLRCRSIAFPLLASGNNGYNLDYALGIAMDTIQSFEPQYILDSAAIVLYGNHAVQVAEEAGFDVYEPVAQDDYSSFTKKAGKNLDLSAFKPVLDALAEAGKEIIATAFNSLVQKAIDYVSDPDNVIKLVKKGDKITKDYFKDH